VSRAFRLRGVVEGFYGEPWSHDARRDVLSFVAERGMNAYVYAPKDDEKHRARWREPYDDDERARFDELAAHCGDAGITFGFAISPGLDMDYASPQDRQALLAKLRPLAAGGVPWFLLLLDDIPTAPGLAPAQADLFTWLVDAMRREREDASLSLCPTEYVGTRSSPYLSELARGLPADVDVMWTGPTVCSPTITVADARGRAAALGGRRPLVWDNFPVSDGPMEPSLHLGPYRGREPGLADEVAGVLCNPMRHPQASKLGLATAADFLRDPDGYDAQTSWRAAIDAVGGVRRGPLRVLAEACADSPLSDPGELDLHRRVDGLREELDGPGWCEPLRNVVEALRAAKRVRDDFDADAHPDCALTREVAPWAQVAAREADVGLAALRLLQQVRPVAVVSNGTGRAALADADAAMASAFAVVFLWAAARRHEHNVFGPRFAVVPAIVQMPDGRPALDVREAVREDRNAVDALCRLALHEYETWRGLESVELRVFVDGEQRALDADGRFDAHGEMVLVRDGHATTRVGAGERLPFRDARLS
jgi:hyaluronoglucosaminidase